MSCQRGHSRNLQMPIPLFSIIYDWTFRSLLTLVSPIPDKTRRRVLSQSLLSNPFTATVMTALGGVNGTVCNAQQYQQSQQSYDSSSPSISCLTHGESIGLAVSIYAQLSPILDSFNIQFVAETSVLSCICVTIIFFWIGVRPASIHVIILFDEMLHSETYNGIRGRSQTVIGGCFRALLTSTWSA